MYQTKVKCRLDFTKNLIDTGRKISRLLAFMKNPHFDKVYTALAVFFAMLAISGNLVYQKFITLSIGNLITFEISVGSLFYPLTFIISDLIAELYGKERAGFCVKIALLYEMVIALVVTSMDHVHAAEWSRVDDESFHLVFGLYSTIFSASIAACYISQMIDIRIYLWIRKVTGGRFLWLRNNASMVVSLFVDTVIMIGLTGFFGIIPEERTWPVVLNVYCFKLLFIVCCTPLFYLSVHLLRKMQQNTAEKST